MRSAVWAGAVVVVSLALTGCGGGKSGGGNGGGGGSSSYTVNGTVSGLTASGLVLEETNSGQSITIQPGTTSFTVLNSVPSGTSYNVIVKTQPTGETCTVANGSGSVGSGNVTNIAVTCAANTYTIGGTITGLAAAGLTLKETVSGQTVSPVANATTFTFPTGVASGASYSVTVSAQPTGETCTVSNASGTVATSNVTNVAVACAANPTPTYTIGGTITGLTASGLTLQETISNQRVSPAVNATAFTFATAEVSGASYSVSVNAQPTGETCTVANGSGTVGSSNVTNIAVSCVANPTYTIGGTISGLTASGLTLKESVSGQTASPAANATSFTFATAELTGASYSVTASAQPTGETCTVANGSGTVGSSNVTNIAVSCTANSTTATKMTGYLIDAPVNGVFYAASPSGQSGTTLSDGSFTYQSGDTVTFTVLGVSLGEAAGQSGGTSIPSGGIVTPFTIANETPGSNSSNAPNSAAIAAFLQTLSNVAAGGTESTTTLLMPSGSGVNALVTALAQETAGNGLTLIETIASNLSTLVSNSSLVVSPATALSDAYTAAQAASSSQTTAGQAYANSVWKISGCSNGGCDLYLLLQANGMITGLNITQNTGFGGTWMVSGNNLEIYLVIPGGGTASATVAGGATNATITYTPTSGSTATATITEDLGSGGAASIPNSGLWYANYTPSTSGRTPGQGIFILAPDGTIVGITTGSSTLTGTWSGTSATAGLANGETCSLNLTAMTGTCSKPNGNGGTLVLSRTALPLPTITTSGTYSGDFYLDCPGCGGSTPSTGTYSASVSSNGNITITLTTAVVGEPGVNFNGSFSGTVSASGVVNATAPSTFCSANGFYTLTGQIAGDALSFSIGLPQYGACNSEYGGSGAPGSGSTATPSNGYTIGGNATFGTETYGNCVALSLTDTTLNSGNSTTIQVGPGCGTPSDFTFAAPITAGDDYAVTIPGSQPIGPYCTVTNGTGTAAANVTNVTVSCNGQSTGSAPFGSSVIKTLYSFQGGTDGANGVGTYNGLGSALIMDSKGNLYGTTSLGGNESGNCNLGGCGTVFELSPTSGQESVLHAFTGYQTTCTNCDGSNPLGDLIMDGSGNLYGTTVAGGGSGASPVNPGSGLIYEVVPSTQVETILHALVGSTDGSSPKGGLLMDTAGDLYGTVSGNSTTGSSGPVFKIAAGSQTPQYTGGYDSVGSANGGLLMDSAGNLYGVSTGIGNLTTPPATCQSGCGTVYEIAKGASTATVLYAFAGGSDGESPDGNLVMDSAGNLYGVTENGGSATYGTVFEIAAGTHTETILYNFQGGSDGKTPVRGLVIDSAGNLYGVTQNGGSTSTCAAGGGTVFEIAAGTHTETILYSFGCTGSNSFDPNNRLLMDGAGNLYGTTAYGGTTSNGTVYEILQSPATGYAMGGTITGLKSPGLVLTDGSHAVSPTVNATTFTFFPNGYATGDAYTVSVQTQPTGQTCSVTNGSGTVGAGNVTNIQVACAP